MKISLCECMYADVSNTRVSAASQDKIVTVTFIELSNFQPKAYRDQYFRGEEGYNIDHVNTVM